MALRAKVRTANAALGPARAEVVTIRQVPYSTVPVRATLPVSAVRVLDELPGDEGPPAVLIAVLVRAPITPGPTNGTGRAGPPYGLATAGRGQLQDKPAEMTGRRRPLTSKACVVETTGSA